MAPEFFWDLTEEEVRKYSNGCGPQNWKIKLIPDKIGEVDFTYSCRIHDICYYYGHTEADKRMADRLLLLNMLADVDAYCAAGSIIDRMQRVLYRQAAWTYYRAVSDFGHDAFWHGDKYQA